MPYEDKVFKDEFVPNIEGANKTSYGQWKQANPKEAAAYEQFRDKLYTYKAGDKLTAPALQTKYGKALVAAGKLHMSVTDIGADYSTTPEPPPPPPPTGNPYFVTDYSSGRFGPPNWTAAFSYASPGFVDMTQTGPITSTSDGRVAVANDPAGSGRKVLRFEIRDSDPDWAVALTPPVDKSEVRSIPQYTWNQSQANYGDIRWLSMKYYLPYNATEKFEWAHTGGNAFIDLNDMHPNNNSWPALQVGWYPQASPEWAKLRVGGGAVVGDTSNLVEYNLWQLTNSSGVRIAANHNRWLTVTLGVRWHYDNTGWIEAYIDGSLVIPRTFRPTMWANDFAMYWKGGLYKQANAVFPESGRSVIYWDTQKIGLLKTDVD